MWDCTWTDFVRKGYGRQILNALTDEAKKAGAKKFYACNRVNNVASRELQLACGFQFESMSEEKTDPRTGEKYIMEERVKKLVLF